MKDAAYYRQWRKIIVKSLVSIDELMMRLVLKGGSAIDLVYGVTVRPSMDVDFSIADSLDPASLDRLRGLIESRLDEGFQVVGFRVFDVVFSQRPPDISADLEDFWGGYLLEFKIISASAYQTHRGDTEALRRRSEAISTDTQTKKFRVEISRHEHCEPKVAKDLDGYTVFVYPPNLIIAEKLRALCQQMDEYAEVVRRSPRPKASRARDVFDIYVLREREYPDKASFDPHAPETVSLMQKVFAAKRVDSRLLGRLGEYREQHRDDFQSVVDTAAEPLEPYDFYFDYVLALIAELRPFWDG